ncbi:PD-(D/E)XK motif protein [Janthinobacterium sp. GMG2]|uniref:PD-(D/E)XK motif protein n=1 Tax=Janthinobacterium sp. GMG2 TaxID=3096606 RepID=UPI0029F5C1E2|nr:PD-(D/E)XK motif protein [Janthinobacterium sp. GMG2]MDX8125435.1 PD-(D/E)XK motif protein [Janthinobacterium sp. GMG2]
MARQNDEFLMAWSSLSGLGEEAGWQAIPIAPALPLELQAGRRSPDNAEAVFVGFPSIHLPAADKMPEGQGFAVERVDPQGDNKMWLALTRKLAGSEELFASMASDVVGALDDAVATQANEQKLLRVFLGRVGAWQEFMRKGFQALSAEAEIGLVGEISVLRLIIDAGVPAPLAVESWRGPLDALQDFELGTGALEVKSTLSAIGFLAQIGSLEQLEDSVRQPLFVVSVRLKQTTTGKTLPEIVDDMQCIVKGDAEAERLLSDRLLAAGFIEQHVDRYVRRFTEAGTRITEVDKNFPRLTLGSVPLGITKASYEIDLDKVVGTIVEIDEALKKLGAMKI